MSGKKKSLERNALDAFIQANHKLKRCVIVDEERPDFILVKDGRKIGIEHFRADTILNEYTDSDSMKFDGQRKKMYAKHHNELLNDKFDVDESAKDIEASINKSLDAISKFDYNRFIFNMRKVFEQHASNVHKYKKKCDEVWFLIDVGIENNQFVCTLNNGGLTKMNVLPITTDILNIFDKHKEINRIIICSRYFEKYNVVYDSDNKKIKYKIKSFTYKGTLMPNRKQIKLVVENTGKEVEP